MCFHVYRGGCSLGKHTLKDITASSTWCKKNSKSSLRTIFNHHLSNLAFTTDFVLHRHPFQLSISDTNKVCSTKPQDGTFPFSSQAPTVKNHIPTRANLVPTDELLLMLFPCFLSYHSLSRLWTSKSRCCISLHRNHFYLCHVWLHRPSVRLQVLEFAKDGGFSEVHELWDSSRRWRLSGLRFQSWLINKFNLLWHWHTQAARRGQAVHGVSRFDGQAGYAGSLARFVSSPLFSFFIFATSVLKLD